MKQSLKYWKIFANLLVAVLVILFIFYFCPKLIIFFMPFVVGYGISLIANPLVRFLEKRLKIVRKHSSMIIIIGVLAGVILILYLVVVRIAQEAMNLVDNLPMIYSSMEEQFAIIGENLQILMERLPLNIQHNITDITSDLTTYIGDFVQAISVPTFAAAGNFAKNVPGTLIAIIMGILSAYFFTAERDKIITSIKEHMPAAFQNNVVNVIKDFKHVVGGYFKAQLKIMVVVYLVIMIGLAILRVDYVILVGFLIAFLDMLPVLGTGTVLGPWAIWEILAGDYKMAIGLIILYGVSQLVRQIIQPKLVGDSIGMAPLTTLIFMYIGFKFGSVMGMIIAVPAGMILINLYRAGVFNNQIHCIRELVNDFNQFRKF